MLLVLWAGDGQEHHAFSFALSLIDTYSKSLNAAGDFHMERMF